MIGSLVKVGVTALVVCGNVFAAGEVMPFPQNKNYAGCIKPGAGDAAMNNSIKSIYLANYKPNLVVSGNECYVDAQGAGPGGASAITISEAHGYGMLLMVLLAGTNGEPNAKSYFDGMVNFYLNHPSKINSKLMSWQISNPFVADDAATDGDMDAAYALVLANAQWGGNPAGQSRSYISIAQDIITNGIKSSEMGSSNYLSLLGDWEKDGGVEVNTRSSDWMPDHMRAFKDATSDDFWTSAASRCYTNISEITAGYSSGTGLMPDFATISSGSTKPDPTAGGTTGEANPDKYSWNACRYPWRITTDYAHYGTAEAKTAMGKLADWLTTKFANPSNIKCGPYNLNGTTSINYTSSAFTGPFIAACITDSKYQSYLNSGWNMPRQWVRAGS